MLIGDNKTGTMLIISLVFPSLTQWKKSVIRIYISGRNNFSSWYDFFMQLKIGYRNGFPDKDDDQKNDSIIIAAVKSHLSITKRRLWVFLIV